MKYDTQVQEIKLQLEGAQNILVAVPSHFNTDKLAAGLALFLALDASKKEVSIVCDGTIKVSDSNLFGVGQVQKTVPATSGGNLTLALEGVVASDGTVPALEKLDWYPEGSNLNLVFHVLPGQRFEPTKITPKMAGSGFDLIFVVGATNLNALGQVYSGNEQIFSNITVVNVDTNPSNTQYGKINIVDSSSFSVCEVVAQILPVLNLPIDGDLASNILAGVYGATANLTRNVNPNSFMVAGQMMQAGGKIPVQSQSQSSQQAPQSTPQQQQRSPQPKPQSQQVSQQPPQQQPEPLNKIFGFPAPEEEKAPEEQNASPEEAPQGERAFSSSPEVSNPDPDWLTPKVFKGTNLG